MDTDQIWSRIELVDKIKFTNVWNSIVRRNSNFRVHIIHFCQKVIVLPKTGILSKTQFWIKIQFSPKKWYFYFRILVYLERTNKTETFWTSELNKKFLLFRISLSFLIWWALYGFWKRGKFLKFVRLECFSNRW